jgi:hypothetical protein
MAIALNNLPGERQALSDLFACVIGSYKSSQSTLPFGFAFGVKKSLA